MTKMRIVLLNITVLTLMLFAAAAFAQAGDPDGDGVSNRIDRCPTVPGPASNYGCPVKVPPQEGGDTPDRDGDGVPDYVDKCPDEVGTGFSEGCPVKTVPDATLVVQPANPQPIMVWNSRDVCMVGVPLTGGNVNVREQPTTSSAIIGHLAPGQQFEPFFRDYDANSAVWFGGAPADNGWGWVADSVVIDNGQCANLPMIVHVDAPSGTNELILPPNLALDLNPGDATPVPASEFDLDTLILTGDHTLVVEGVQPSTERGRGHDKYMIITLKDVYVTGFDSGPHPEPGPQPTPAPSPARPLPVLLVIADMQDGCAAIDHDHCLVMALRLPEFGDQPGECPVSDDAAGQRPRKTPVPTSSPDHPGSHGTHIPDAVIDLLKIAPPIFEPGAGHLAPQVMLDGDGSVMPVDANDANAHWDYACSVIGFVPNGETEAMGDGSVRFHVDTVVMLPPSG